MGGRVRKREVVEKKYMYYLVSEATPIYLVRIYYSDQI
jgi:hypothetical protein